MSALTAVYDLAVSPPTYDFISFLCSAEQERRERGHEFIDVVFSPGPNMGFRDDNLPPQLEERDSMLWRVCVGMTRLLPTVRNVTVQRARYHVDGRVWPKGWSKSTPASNYGTYLFKTMPRCLEATLVAKKALAFPKPYVTITERSSRYWPSRNSNKEQWEKAAEEIEKMGYEVIWVPDTSEGASPVCWDIDLRCALYQGAVCNLGVSNGPMYLAVFANAPYLIFKMIVPDCPSTTADFLASHGFNQGDQISDTGKLVWEDDTAEVIIAEFATFLANK